MRQFTYSDQKPWKYIAGVSDITFQIVYNPRSYRWEIWGAGSRLPSSTHPSKDGAMLAALSLLRDLRRGRLVVYDEAGHPETLLEAKDCHSGSKRALENLPLRPRL